MPASPLDPVCQRLPWDSKFFGVEVARVNGDTLDRDRAALIDTWCQEHQIQLLYFLARSDDSVTTQAAQASHYREVDVRVTLERSLAGYQPAASRSTVSTFIESDLPALRQIARSSYTDSRFYHDGRLPRAKCDELYDIWTTQACEREPDHVLVARDGGEAVGYVSCSINPESRRSDIVLIGVAQHARGRGIGKSLVETALNWAAARNSPVVSVVTQGRNVAAQRLYEGCGFVTRSLGRYYHKWYE